MIEMKDLEKQNIVEKSKGAEIGRKIAETITKPKNSMPDFVDPQFVDLILSRLND